MNSKIIDMIAKKFKVSTKEAETILNNQTLANAQAKTIANANR